MPAPVMPVPIMPVYGSLYDQHKRPLTLGEKLGAGGEGEVYALADDATQAVKLYSKPTVLRSQKLTAMLAKPPESKRGHAAIAWPTSPVCDAQGQVVGFVMPRVHGVRGLHELYHPKTRRTLASDITWRHLVSMAHNLCSVVARLHAKGYVIGDLNESNVLVNRQALITLIDCDSMQVQTEDAIYRCLVSKAEYLAPELQSKDFHKTTRHNRHDVFALAVLVFMLLMEGTSPFAGSYQGEGAPPTLLHKMRTGNSPYLRFGKLKAAAVAPPFKMLPRKIRRLFRQSLRPRLWWQPLSWRRPTASRWQDALKSLEHNLSTCTSNPNHVYAGHFKHCPWCARAAKLGLDPYPASPEQQRAAAQKLTARAKKGQFWQRVWTRSGLQPWTRLRQRERSTYRTPLVLGGSLFVLQDVLNRLLTVNRYAAKLTIFIALGIAVYVLLNSLKRFRWTAMVVRLVEYTLRIFLIAYLVGILLIN